MRLRMLSVIGASLNFGGRGMGTVARLSWLPVVLLLIVNMVTIFAYLTVIAGRVITFEEAGTFTAAQQALAQYVDQAWQGAPLKMAAITAVNLIFQALLTASFMAPLTRYAGLGEKPHGGLFRMPFGVDQLRYVLAGLFSFLFVGLLILAPLAGATYYVLKYIFDGLSQTLASFPDPNSLHTIEFITAGQQLAAGGEAFYLNVGIPLLAAIPFAFVLWAVVYFHFHPANRPSATSGANPLLRSIVTMAIAALAAGASYLLLRENILELFTSAGSANEGIGNIVTNTPVNARLLIGAILFVLAGYLNLRLYPYPGVAVCRKSLGLGGTLRVTRGWNLLRLQLILIAVGVAIFVVQTVVLNTLFLGFLLPWVVGVLYQAVDVSARLASGGDTAEWILPVFVWTWNGIKILVNIIGLFFAFGVLAGLYGRLYRESERDEEPVTQTASPDAIWRKPD